MKLLITQNARISFSGRNLKANGRGEVEIPLKELEGIGLFVRLRNFERELLQRLKKRNIYTFLVLPGRELEILSHPKVPSQPPSHLSPYLLIELKAKETASYLKRIGTASGSSLEVKPFVSDILGILKEIGKIKGSFNPKSSIGYIDQVLYSYILMKLEYAPFPSKEKKGYLASLILYYREVAKGLLGFVLKREGIKLDREFLNQLCLLLEPFIAFKSADILFSTRLLPEDFTKRGSKYILKAHAVPIAVKTFIEGFNLPRTLMPIYLYLRKGV